MSFIPENKIEDVDDSLVVVAEKSFRLDNNLNSLMQILSLNFGTKNIGLDESTRLNWAFFSPNRAKDDDDYFYSVYSSHDPCVVEVYIDPEADDKHFKGSTFLCRFVIRVSYSITERSFGKEREMGIAAAKKKAPVIIEMIENHFKAFQEANNQ